MFFPGLVCVAVLIYGIVHALVGGRESFYPLIGVCVGVLPSLRLGTPSRMGPLPASDRARIATWMQAHKHVFDPERGWVPRLPRALYFDSQIVRDQGDCVIGPLITLRKLRTVLQMSSHLSA